MQTPQIVAISDRKIRQAEVLAKLGKGPVFLAKHSKARAVLVSLEEWDRQVTELAHLRHLAMLDERSRQVGAGQYLTQEQVGQGLRERVLID
jgi:PHD/YefM family antitoxin component YafN of YafNO toxin-antitoxin module